MYRLGRGDSSSGSITRSSSRTTSGNTTPSRSPSRSISNDSNTVELEAHEQPRKRRFLQRWEDDDVSQAQPVTSSNTKREPSPEKLPYVYQQSEMIRISQDIIRKCDSEDQLISFFQILDRGEYFDLSLLSDLKLRKKLRHLAKALYLERDGQKFKTPPECNISLVSTFKELLPYIKIKANAQGPYKRARVTENPLTEKVDANFHPKLSTSEASELLSLREMHEQGFFVDYENVQKEFMKKHQQLDVWGKTAEQQKVILASKDKGSNSDDEQPWRVFDRERDLESGNKIGLKEYKKLLVSNKDFHKNFDSVSNSTSFL